MSWLASNWNTIANGVVIELIVAAILSVLYYVTRIVKRNATVKTVLGIAIIFIGTFIVITGAHLWDSTFQVSKATSPFFIWSSLIASIGMIVLYIVGILVIIYGGYLINKERTKQVLKILYEHFKRLGIYDSS
jgi:uncharacterized membrane protein YidH (DUF202 family)